MRIILKPGGLFLVFLALLIPGGFLLLQSLFHQKSAAPASHKAAPAAPTTSASLVNLIQDGSFEEPFLPVPTPPITSKAHVTGEISKLWTENSDWADLTLNYAHETVNPHSGLSCQKINVGAINNGQAQYAYSFQVPPATKLHASIWMRTDGAASTGDDNVEFALRKAATADQWYAEKYVTVGPQWTKVEIDGKTQPKSGLADDSTFLMIIIRKPNTTICIDDVEADVVP